MNPLVVIPAFNEAPRIARVIANVRAALPHADILVVNDGSYDATAECARQGGARVVSLPFNLGYGVALQTGYKYAPAKFAKIDTRHLSRSARRGRIAAL